jgi:hypothetical protein
MDFKKLLSECTTTPSTLTKTGVFYVKDNVIVLEFMKSTKNVWVDSAFAENIPDKAKAEKEITEFFGYVKSVMFTMELSEFDNKLKNGITKILNDNGVEGSAEKVNDIIKAMRSST